MPRSYILKEWAYPVLLFFFVFTFLALFLSSIGISLFSFWQKILVAFILGGGGTLFHKVLFSLSYFLFLVLFLYLLKLEYFPTFLENITLIRNDIGKVRVSQRAIWELVERKLSDFPYVKTLKMYITAQDMNFSLHLHIDLVGDDSDLSDLEKKAFAISSELREYIYDAIGIQIKDVDVLIEGIRYSFKEERKDE